MHQTNTALYLAGQLVEDTEQLVKTYVSRIGSLGISAETMFYKSEYQHHSKIIQFASLLAQLVEQTDVVLDVGCGYGALVPFLPKCRYIGVDVVPEFVKKAQYSYPTHVFIEADVKQKSVGCDWAVFLGVVNGVPEPSKLVLSVWDTCRKGVVIDFVDEKKVPGDFKDLNRFDMGECLNAFLDIQAKEVLVCPTSSIWTIFVAKRK